MTQLESLLAEREAITEDLEMFGEVLNAWTYDELVSRVEMLDSMIEIETNGY